MNRTFSFCIHSCGFFCCVVSKSKLRTCDKAHCHNSKMLYVGCLKKARSYVIMFFWLSSDRLTWTEKPLYFSSSLCCWVLLINTFVALWNCKILVRLKLKYINCTKTHFNESEWGLYSIGKFAGRLRIRLSTSLIRFVLPMSVAVRFQTERRSSGYWVESTMPQISGPTRNCSPCKMIKKKQWNTGR